MKCILHKLGLLILIGWGVPQSANALLGFLERIICHAGRSLSGCSKECAAHGVRPAVCCLTEGVGMPHIKCLQSIKAQLDALDAKKIKMISLNASQFQNEFQALSQEKQKQIKELLKMRLNAAPLSMQKPLRASLHKEFCAGHRCSLKLT